MCLGSEGGGAILAGLRYGKGTLYLRQGGTRPIHWHGPSVGYDFGAEGGRTLILVYSMRDPEQLYRSFTGIDGSAYLVGGVGMTLLKGGDVIMAPIRSGLGLHGQDVDEQLLGREEPSIAELLAESLAPTQPGSRALRVELRWLERGLTGRNRGMRVDGDAVMAMCATTAVGPQKPSTNVAQPATNPDDQPLKLFVSIKRDEMILWSASGLEGTLTDAVSRLIIENAILPRFRTGDFAGDRGHRPRDAGQGGARLTRRPA